MQRSIRRMMALFVVGLLGSLLLSPVTMVVAQGTHKLDVFSRGPDGAIWTKTWNGSAWVGWISLGTPPGGALTSDPTAVWHGSASLTVFARGPGHQLWARGWNGSSWGGWWSLGGSFPGGADAAGRSDGRIDVFARGWEGQIWTRTWNGSSWGAGWGSIGAPAGGSLTSDPTAVWQGTGSLNVFARGPDNQLWTRGWNGSAWGSWWSLGGSFPGGADAAVHKNGRIDLFARGWEGHMWTRTWNGSSWGAGWSDMGGWFSSDPGAVWSSDNHLTVFGLGGDNQVWQMAWNGSAWVGWTPLGGPLAGGQDAASPYVVGQTSGTDRVSLATWIRNSAQITLARVHPSGVQDNAFAWNNIVDTANGGMAQRSNYSCPEGSAPGGSVWLQVSMLGGMKELASSWSYNVSEIAGACHSTTSRHYDGVAVDVDTINGMGVSSSNPYQNSFRSRCAQLGATEVLGPGNAGHSSHIHCAWPRP